MKRRGKVRQVADPITGKLEWSEYPMTREEAIREDVAKYWPMTPCPEHKYRSVHFTVTGEAACCAQHSACAAYNDAVLVRKEPSTILQANTMGVGYYWSTPEGNHHCGHPSKLLLSGKCAFCAEAKETNPRKVAIESGKAWYQPRETDLCANGHTALRRVANGSCKQCEDDAKEKAKQARAGAAVMPIHKVMPDAEISKKEAIEAGHKVYRTGRACAKGHKGWRYISTGGCLDCMGRG